MNFQVVFFSFSHKRSSSFTFMYTPVSLSLTDTQTLGIKMCKKETAQKILKNCFGIYRMAQWNWELREGYAFVGDGGKGTQLIPARKCFASFETRSLKARLSLVALLFSPPLSRLAHVLQLQ